MKKIAGVLTMIAIMVVFVAVNASFAQKAGFDDK